MLKMKNTCEKCAADLSPNAIAYICSYECTFCESCNEDELKEVCPNCNGNLVLRPKRIEKPK